MKNFYIAFAFYAMASLSPVYGATTAESIALAKDIKIADVHMHLSGETTQALLEKMNRIGIAWGGGVGGIRPDGPVRVKAALGKRYIAALGQAEYQAVLMEKGEKGLHDMTDPRFVNLFESAEKLFSERTVRIFGEIHINNVKSGVNSGFQINTSFDTPSVQKMYELANRHNAFVQIHSEGTQNFDEIKKIARDFPKATTIFSHCIPFTSPSDIRQLFKDHSNLICDLSAGGPSHRNMRIFTSSGPRLAWLELIEEFPDRFMLGTDPCCGLAPKYDELVRELRVSLLPYLKVETLRKVAFQNAVRVFGLED
jgi:hypothetical protein